MLWRKILNKRGADFHRTLLKTRQLERSARSKLARRCSSSVITFAGLIKLPSKRLQVDEKWEIWLTQVAMISAPKFSFWRRFGESSWGGREMRSASIFTGVICAQNGSKKTPREANTATEFRCRDSVPSRTRGELDLASCARRIGALLEAWTLAATLKSFTNRAFQYPDSQIYATMKQTDETSW